MEELEALPLPGDVSEGVIYTVVETKPVNGYKVTGKVSDLFLTGNQTDFNPELEGMYAYAPQFTVPDSCVCHNSLSGNSIYVYNSSGKFLSSMNYPYVDGYPSWISFENLGVDSVDDEITLYIAELSQPMELEPEEIIFEDVERAMYHNGESWVEIVTAKHLGDIDKALDAILALDEKLLGGDA